MVNSINPGEIVLFHKDERPEHGNDLKRLLQFFRYCKIPGVLNLGTVHQENYLENYLNFRENIQFGCQSRGLRSSDFEKFCIESQISSLTKLLEILPNIELPVRNASTLEKLIANILRVIYQDSKYLFCNFSDQLLDPPILKIISETLFLHAKLNKKFLFITCPNLFPLECFDKMVRQNPSGHFEVNKFKYTSEELLMRAKNFRQRLVLFGDPVEPASAA